MNTVKIIIYHGKHGDVFWLADTRLRAAEARKKLFRQLDKNGCYAREGINLLGSAREGDDRAIEIILLERAYCAYERWEYEYVEVLSDEPMEVKHV